MTVNVVTVDPETPVQEIADLRERHRIKRVPVVCNGALVGIVSRANLVRALASGGAVPAGPGADRTTSSAASC
jgi:CBS domain-containing protein